MSIRDATSLDPEETLPQKLAHDLRARPRESKIQIIEASADRLVLYLAADEKFGTILFRVAAAVNVIFWACAALWPDVLLLRGANVNRNTAAGVLTGWLCVTIFGVGAVIYRFERTYLLLDRERLMMRRVLFGFARTVDLLLVPSSRAELLAAGQDNPANDGIRVDGRNATISFGNVVLKQESKWLAELINDFIAYNSMAASKPARLGRLDSHELPFSSPIRVDVDSSERFQCRWLPFDTDLPLFLLKALSSLALVVWILFLLGAFDRLIPLPGFMRVGALAQPMLWLSRLCVPVVYTGFVFYVWAKTFSQNSIVVTPRSLTCRKHFGWLDLSPRRIFEHDEVADIRVESSRQGWSIVLGADRPCKMGGFTTETAAQQAALLIRTKLNDLRNANA